MKLEDLFEKTVKMTKLATKTGTVEFIYEDGKFYFLEMIQSSSRTSVSEMVTGIDIIKEQIWIAYTGAALHQSDINPRGHAIECRINADQVKIFNLHQGY